MTSRVCHFMQQRHWSRSVTRPITFGDRLGALPLYTSNALSEMSFRHQAPGQRMHLTAV